MTQRIVVYLATCALWAVAAVAQDPPTEDPANRWTREAELSLVATDGNSETSSLGFGGKLEKKGTSSRFEASFGGVRADSTDTTHTAVAQDDGSVVVTETTDSGLTAENYFAKARLDHDLAAAWYRHVGAAWERDPFAGIDHRFQAIVGLGRKLRDETDHTWRLDGGLTWTGERLTVDDRRNFLGVRLLSDWSRQITETTRLQHSFQVDEDLDQTEDYRIETKFTAQVSISKRLALKVGLQAKYDNVPAHEELDVVDGNGDAVDDQTVLVPLEELDLKATVSLVVNF